MMTQEKKLTLALPKGRILEQVLPILKKADITPEDDFFDPKSRKLIFQDQKGELDIIRVRSFDMATFIAFGAAQIGIAGSDVLEEFNYSEIYAPLDLQIGKCRLSLAAKEDAPNLKEITNISHMPIATKYPNVTKKFFAKHHIQAETIHLNGAMELAPKVGLSQYIVDLVETGSTLKANGLSERETLLEVSSRLVIHRGSAKIYPQKIQDFIQRFQEAIAS